MALKWLLYMKLTATLILVACLAASANGFSQRISLQVSQAPIEKVMEEISRQSGYEFLYTTKHLEKAKKIDLKVTDASLTEVLELCFTNQPLTYKIIDKTIVVQPRDQVPGGGNNTPPIPLIDVQGRITDENGDAVVASVQVKGTNKGTSTNTNGEFSISGVADNSILQITGVSIEPMEVKVNGRGTINVTAKNKVSPLEEVIIKKGYYDEKKETSAGSVVTVTGKEISRQPVNNPLLGLQGRVAGAYITPGPGLPGSSVTIQIRGQNSIGQGSDPLYVVDGVPFPNRLFIASGAQATMLGSLEGNSFAGINPADIESITILKDADATAIYGSRGANGVILITTKKGRAGKMRLDLNMQTGFSQVGHKLKLLNTEQYLEMRREAFKNDGATPDPNADFDLTLWDPNRNTDWQEELIGGTGEYTDIQAAISGGTELAQYRLNLGYNRETTVYPDDRHNNRKFASLQVNGSSADKKIFAQATASYTVAKGQLPTFDLTRLALGLPPNAPALYNSDGSINWAPGPGGPSTWPGYSGTPLTANLRDFFNDNYTLVATGSAGYRPVKGLELKVNAGYNILRTEQVNTQPLASIDPFARPSSERSSSFVNGTAETWNVEPQVSYTTSINKGILSAQAGWSIQQSENKGQGTTAYGFSSDLSLENLSDAARITQNNQYSLYKYNALFARLSFSYDKRYTVNVTANRNGSSNFGPANRYHTFGSGALAYTFSHERFMQRLLPVLSFGKLRLSYGFTGNDQVAAYSYLDLYSPLPSTVRYQGATGYLPGNIFTPGLQWEETRKLEAGLELGFFKDRLNVELNFYRNRSTNQLMSRSLSSVTGFSGVTENLDAVIENKGWEFMLNTVNIDRRKFQWRSSLNVSVNRNRLLSLPPTAQPSLQRYVGHPLNVDFVFHYLGVNIISGLYEFADSEGKPTSTPNSATDRNTIVDLTPSFYGGLQNSLSFKGLELDFLFQFAKKIQRAYLFGDQPGSKNPLSLGGSNQPYSVMDRWQVAGDVAPNQRFSQNSGPASTAFAAARQSDMQLQDASYLRLKTLSLGWLVPDKLTRRLHLQHLRFAVQGQNLWTLTKFQGLDPELFSTLQLPPLRTITFKITIGI